MSKILRSPAEIIESRSDPDEGYKHFSRGLTGILMTLVLVPLIILSILMHHQYKQLLQSKELDQLILNLELAQSTIEKFVAELQSVIKFVAPHNQYQQFLDPRELEALFVRLKGEYPGFADIEIIDSLGMQKSYYGPYQLEGHNYTDQTWYKEVILHGAYISTIFSGFRDVNHFVIAVRVENPEQKSDWVLRVTIDEKTLQNFVDTTSTSYSYADDIYLIDSFGIAQTEPRKYGTIGEECLLCNIQGTANKSLAKAIADRDTKGMEIVEKAFKGQQVLHATAELANTPWRLVLVKEQYLFAHAWVLFKIKLITIFLCCTIVAVIVILQISSAITSHIRESDNKQKKILAEIQHTNKLASIGRLAAGVAHEINNPLAIINQKAGLVQDFIEISGGCEHQKSMEDALDGIQNSVERCKTVTHRLLGFARHTEVKTDEIDINVLVREVIDFLAQEASYNQIRIDFDLDQNISTIFSDRGQLQQVFLNITNNAIDAIGKNGHITMSSRQVDQETIQIGITDNGPGIPPEVKQRIFDPFFTTKETGKGTGLGLSISYGLVKKLGGNINVISEVDKGTQFEITLPVTQPQQDLETNERHETVNN